MYTYNHFTLQFPPIKGEQVPPTKKGDNIGDTISYPDEVFIIRVSSFAMNNQMR
jgi:hypothetical protein